MAEILPMIFLLASHLFVSGVLSVSILTIENKCDHKVWPMIYSWTSSQVNSTGFALKKGAERDIRAPFAWYGLISGRTLCSADTSTRNFSCATGDCESGKSSATYASFRLDKGGFDSYAVSVEYGYNLPIMVVPSMKRIRYAGELLFVLPTGVSTALLVMVIVVAIAVIVRAKNASRKSDQNDANIEAAVMLKRYSYENVKKMTNSFAHVLGKGGSGTVYKGKLPDSSGRDIALKILKESKGDGEEFINELASMKSAISLLNARGTVGYNAPEVFSKNFGEVSHKSDVYSYGMVVLEMIRAKNMKSVGNSRSENVSMYFPDWIYEDLERKETMNFSRDHIIEQEEKIAKKMALVGLWCIQTSPSDRPPMKEVVEMLEGSLEALQVPPKPLLNLPFATPWESVADSQATSNFSTLNTS
ncbi:hypothetical protein Bca52824_018467 [Brassica carinata]|uniref:Serine-threonine/tyrosine-protein kinase catalytic domain-containing protein n=1 Tax=Brassica carinata TaxID=52824 RepID=A0A8X7VQY8_BRACI|nr:hypothetical protein Bca52824_018467 [Brassica carinata]